MPVNWRLFHRKPLELGVCCHCGKAITELQLQAGEVVTIVAAEYGRLRAHRECHFFQRAGIEWPNDR